VAYHLINVLTWLWRQEGVRVSYTAEHVNIWADMVRRNLSMKHKISCVTNMPEGIDSSINIIPLPTEFADVKPAWGPHKPNCFRRLAMFRKDAAKTFGKRFLCMDLDCVIAGPLDPLFDRKEDLVLFEGTDPSRPYNGSMMLITAGCRPQLYDDFDQAGADVSGAKFHGSDQAWIAHKLGWNEATWGEADGVWHWKRYWPLSKKVHPTILFFPGKRKPWEFRKIFPFIRDNYCLTMREAA
jgi:hypothetical protein